MKVTYKGPQGQIEIRGAGVFLRGVSTDVTSKEIVDELMKTGLFTKQPTKEVQ